MSASYSRSELIPAARQLGYCGIPEEAIVGQLPNNCLCVFCENVTVSPSFASECGHRYCERCILLLFYLKENSSTSDTLEDLKRLMIDMPSDYDTPAEDTKCICCEPSCGSPLNWELIFPDAALAKKLLRVSCKCLNDGCDFTDKYSLFVRHRQACQFALSVCKFCWKQFKFNELNDHQMVCDERPDVTQIECEFCRKTVPAGIMSDHLNSTCPDTPVKCSYCSASIIRCKLNEHQKTCQLSGRCIFGCEVESGTNAEEHYLKFEVIHQQRFAGLLKNTEDSGVLLKADDQILYEIYTQLEGNLNISIVPSLFAAGTGKSPDVFKLISAVGDVSSVQAVRERLNKLEEKGARLHQSAESAYRSIQESIRLSTDNLTYFAMLKDELDSEQRILQRENIYLIERQVKIQNDKTIDGTLVWRIENVSNIFTQLTGDKSIYSSPFYTAPNGYKLRLRLFPNGDSQVEGEYMSLYVVICRGEYDPINKWPFSRTIELTCMDQRVSLQFRKQQTDMPQFKHLTYQLKITDPTLPALQRPRSEFNPSFGISKFLKLPGSNAAEGDSVFIKDDVMFIRAIVLPF